MLLLNVLYISWLQSIFELSFAIVWLTSRLFRGLEEEPLAVWGVWTSTKHLFEMGLVFLRKKKKTKEQEEEEGRVWSCWSWEEAITPLQYKHCRGIGRGVLGWQVLHSAASHRGGRAVLRDGAAQAVVSLIVTVSGSSPRGARCEQGGSAVPRCPCPNPLCAVGRDGHSTHCRRAERPAVLPVEQEHFQHLRRVFAVPAIPVCAGHNVDPYVKALEEQRAEGAVGAEGLLSKLHTLGRGGRMGVSFARFCLRNKLLL